MLDIVFMGSPEFAVPSLLAMHNSDHRLLAVVTNPDKRRGRGSGKSPTIIKKKALELGYPVIEADSMKDPGFKEKIRKISPDLLIVVAFRILPAEILEIPRLGSINLHASLLPKYRGAAPIHWAVMNGEKETGCTIFFLDENVDTGRIIKQVKTAIGPDESAGDVYNRLKELGAGLLTEVVDLIEDGNLQTVSQDEEQATPAAKLFTNDCKIDFNMDSVQVHNKIRGLSPFPGAWAVYNGKKINLYKSKRGPDKKLDPGQLLYDDGRLLAGCGKGTVELLELQLPGKKRVSGADFANGYDLNIRLH